jgi:hypothetical protein
MPTECSRDLFGFAPVAGCEGVAAFDGGAITSDAGALHGDHGFDRGREQALVDRAGKGAGGLFPSRQVQNL